MGTPSVVYVVGEFTDGSGGFDWFRNPFDAGEAFANAIHSRNQSGFTKEDVRIWYAPVLVPYGHRGEEVTSFIDEGLIELEEASEHF